MAIRGPGLSDVEVHHQAAHIKRSHSIPLLCLVFWPHLLHSSVSQVRVSRLVFLAAPPANLYANEKIIINEVHAWLAPINTTLHQQTIQMATFYTARQLGGVLMWWGKTISMPLSSGFIYPLPHKWILLSLKWGLNSTAKLSHFTYMRGLQFSTSIVLHLISITDAFLLRPSS